MAAIDQSVWDGTVREIAHRSLTMQSLVDFLRDLPGRMPSYDPDKTMTWQVVVEVVVPATAAKGCSWAQLVDGKEALPDKMATHTWGNVFTHTMAAIFADALGYADFFHVIHLLSDAAGLAILEAMLADKGLLESRRWLCFFCVNQHVTICPESCPCGLKKLTTGDMCEVNKFDDMLEFISKQPGYQHLLAGDQDFNALERIWVIAEIAEAVKLKLDLAFIPHISNACDAADRVSDLDVRTAKAKYDADRVLILGKIDDKDEFNKQSQVGFMKPMWCSVVKGVADYYEKPLPDFGPLFAETDLMQVGATAIHMLENVCNSVEHVGFRIDELEAYTTLPQKARLSYWASVGDLRGHAQTRKELDTRPGFKAMLSQGTGRHNDWEEFLKARVGPPRDEGRALGPSRGGVRLVKRECGPRSLEYHKAEERTGVRVLAGARTVAALLTRIHPCLVAVVAQGDADLLAMLRAAHKQLWERNGPNSEHTWDVVWLYHEAAPGTESSVALHVGHGPETVVTPYAGPLSGEAAAETLGDFVREYTYPLGSVVELAKCNQHRVKASAKEGLLVAMLEMPADPALRRERCGLLFAAAGAKAAGAAGVPFVLMNASDRVGRLAAQRLAGENVKHPALVALLGDLTINDAPAEPASDCGIDEGGLAPERCVRRSVRHLEGQEVVPADLVQALLDEAAAAAPSVNASLLSTKLFLLDDELQQMYFTKPQEFRIEHWTYLDILRREGRLGLECDAEEAESALQRIVMSCTGAMHGRVYRGSEEESKAGREWSVRQLRSLLDTADLGADHSFVAGIRRSLAELLMPCKSRLRQYRDMEGGADHYEAIAQRQMALQIDEARLGAGHADLIEQMESLVSLLSERHVTGKTDECVALRKKLIGALTSKHGAESKEVDDARTELSDFFLLNGRLDDAKAMYRDLMDSVDACTEVFSQAQYGIFTCLFSVPVGSDVMGERLRLKDADDGTQALAEWVAIHRKRVEAIGSGKAVLVRSLRKMSNRVAPPPPMTPALPPGIIMVEPPPVAQPFGLEDFALLEQEWEKELEGHQSLLDVERDETLVATCRHNLAIMFLQQKRPGEAVEQLQMSLAVCGRGQLLAEHVQVPRGCLPRRGTTAGNQDVTVTHCAQFLLWRGLIEAGRAEDALSDLQATRKVTGGDMFKSVLGSFRALLADSGHKDTLERFEICCFNELVAELGEQHPQVAAARSELKLRLLEEGCFDAAEKLGRDTISQCRSRGLGEVDDLGRDVLSVAFSDFVDTLSLSRKFAAAAEECRVWQDAFPPNSPQAVQASVELARALVDAGRCAEAGQELARILSVAHVADPPSNINPLEMSKEDNDALVVKTYLEQAGRLRVSVLTMQERWSDLAAIYQETLEGIGADAYNEGRTIDCVQQLCGALARIGRHDQADTVCIKAVGALEAKSADASRPIQGGYVYAPAPAQAWPILTACGGGGGVDTLSKLRLVRVDVLCKAGRYQEALAALDAVSPPDASANGAAASNGTVVAVYGGGASMGGIGSNSSVRSTILEALGKWEELVRQGMAAVDAAEAAVEAANAARAQAPAGPSSHCSFYPAPGTIQPEEAKDSATMALAGLLLRQGTEESLARAEKIFRRMLGDMKPAVGEWMAGIGMARVDEWTRGVAHLSLGKTLFKQGKREEAAATLGACFDTMLAILSNQNTNQNTLNARRMSRNFPGRPWSWDAPEHEEEVADMLVVLHEPSAGVDVLQRLIDARAAQRSPTHPSVMRLRQKLAEVLARVPDRDRAASELKAVLEMLLLLYGECDAPRVCACRAALVALDESDA